MPPEPPDKGGEESNSNEEILRFAQDDRLFFHKLSG
jgi:hypothetical protein